MQAPPRDPETKREPEHLPTAYQAAAAAAGEENNVVLVIDGEQEYREAAQRALTGLPRGWQVQAPTTFEAARQIYAPADPSTRARAMVVLLSRNVGNRGDIEKRNSGGTDAFIIAREIKKQLGSSARILAFSDGGMLGFERSEMDGALQGQYGKPGLKGINTSAVSRVAEFPTRAQIVENASYTLRKMVLEHIGKLEKTRDPQEL